MTIGPGVFELILEGTSMFRKIMKMSASTFVAVASLLGVVCAQDQLPPVAAPTLQVVAQPMMPQPVPATEVEPTSAIEKVSPGVFRIGLVTINKQERSITFSAEVNMDQGLLEYLLVKSSGKTHESLLRTRVEPFHLQLACLLLGLEGTTRPLAFQGAPETPTGDAVTVTLTVTDKAGQSRTIKPETWLAKMQEMKPAPVESLSLVFTGSMLSAGRFMAQSEGSMIALYHDPVAIIDNSSPGGETHNYWAVREGATPPVGTPVTVLIKPTSHQGKE
jgi:hypothetical protein